MSIYKIISKVLYLRLSEVLGKTISAPLNCFYWGVNRFLMAFLLLRDGGGCSKEEHGLIFRLDFNKAYD